MLYYNRIDSSESTDVNKTRASKKCIICHYWYFLQRGFTFQSSACNGYHDVLIISVDINIISVLNMHGDYYFIIGITKN